MSGTSSSSPLPRPGGDARGAPGPESGGSGDGRTRRTLVWAGGVALLAIAALLAAALIPGSHHTGDGGSLGRAAVARGGSPANHLKAHESSVFDSKISAKNYGTLVSEMENGVDAKGRAISELSPIPAREFRRPVAEYRAYAERWAVRLGHDVTPLTTALRAGDRGVARRDWMTAFSDYLHLGAVYGLLPGNLNDRLAGLPPQIGSTHFVGLHRIEMGLWTNESVRSLAPLGVKLSSTVVDLRRSLRTVDIDPLDYATRAHEILEDAQRDLMSGSQVPWSHAGVLGTAAGLTATRKVIATLVPLLQGRENTLGTSQYWLQRLQHVLNRVRRPDGSYPTLGELSPTQRQDINAVLAGTVGTLQQVPPTLETADVAQIPKLPAHK